MGRTDQEKKILRNKYSQDIKKTQKNYPEDAFFIEKNKDQIIALHLLSTSLSDVVNSWAENQELTPIDFLSFNAVMKDCIKNVHSLAESLHGGKFANFLKKHFHEEKTLSDGELNGNQPTEHPTNTKPST